MQFDLASKQIIQDEEGKVKTDAEEVAETWRKYCKKLYAEEEELPDDPRFNTMEEKEPPILLDEVIQAIEYLKNNKAPGPDKVIAEVFKAGSKEVTHQIHNICNLIWLSSKWLEDWVQSTYQWLGINTT
ncbi:unnamed protein product [Allacma fusca]|uniref:Uncharacterized protein n=1 Tax=Allacma fusca TaxID=39272 RepID=A0A8J2PDL7_9HEXA|nr:unnamed protein product [Allacma fusca]